MMFFNKARTFLSFPRGQFWN